MRKNPDDSSPYQSNCPRVLVVENNLRWRHDHQYFLEQWGYQAVVAKGEGQDLLRDAREKAEAFRCQLALVDMHLFHDKDEDDQSGLDLVPQLFPTRSIVVSSSVGWLPPVAAIQEKRALGYVAKPNISTHLRPLIDKEAQLLCACRHPAQFDWKGIVPAIFFPPWFSDTGPIPEDEANDVLVQLFPKAERISIRILREDRSNLTSAPRPRSLVLQVQVNDLQPMIVKLARREKIQREIHNFREYVENRLPGMRVPHMNNDIVLWDIGGAAYEYVGDFENIRLLSDLFFTEHRTQIIACLDDFFMKTWASHYTKNVEEKQNETLFENYCRVWESRWYEQLREVERSGRIGQIFASSSKQKFYGGPDPVRWLINRVELGRAGYFPVIKLAMTHGDLHGDNLLMDIDSKIAWVIDFERTGYGPILQDFAELETDIINRLVKFDQDEYNLFYQLCIFVAQPSRLNAKLPTWSDNPRLSLAFHIIAHIRQIAFQLTGILGTEEYIWGLLLNTLFRTKLLLDEGNSSSELNRALMFASILCHRLDAFDQEESVRQKDWPPEDWPSPARLVHPAIPRPARSRRPPDLKDQLARTRAFESPLHLRAMLVATELSYLRAEVPEAQTTAERIGWVLERLQKDAPDGRLLALFLREVASSCEDPATQKELENIISQSVGGIAPPSKK